MGTESETDGVVRGQLTVRVASLREFRPFAFGGDPGCIEETGEKRAPRRSNSVDPSMSRKRNVIVPVGSIGPSDAVIARDGRNAVRISCWRR